MNNASDEQIVKLCRKLWYTDPLRRQAEMVLANGLAPIDDLRPLLRAFKTRSELRETKGAVAAWLVENAAWTEEQRDTITSELSVRVEKAIRSRKPAMYTCIMLYRGIFLSLALWPGCTAYLRWEEGLPDTLDLFFNSIILPACFALMMSYFSVLVSIARDNRTLNPMRRAVKLLGKMGGPPCLGALATAYMHKPMRVAAGAALKQVAARVRPEDYGTLLAQTVPSLCRALPKTNQDMALVILNILETIGDERAIDAVARKITKTGSPEVRELARRVLETLRQRADESRTSGTLLRPSSAAPDSQQVLLRATIEPGDNHEEQLLRVDGE